MVFLRAAALAKSCLRSFCAFWAAVAALAALAALSGLSDGNGRGVSRCLGSANKDKGNAGGGGTGMRLGDCQSDCGVGGGVRRGDRRNANVFGDAIVE